jgi:uncharacterized protein YecT (DUF1311 family)
MRAPVFAVLSACLIPTAALAKDPPIDCAKQTTTVEQNFCADADFDAADKDLNKAYAAALARIAARSDIPAPYDAKSFEAAVRAAQRAWIAFRNSECKGVVPFQFTGGTATTAAVLSCMTDKTKARTKELTEGIEPL